MKKYKKGETLTYRDTGEVSLVKVIEDRSNEDEVILELEIVEVLQESAIVKSSNPGDIFIARSLRKYSTGLGWYIEENPEEEQ